jgi:hypothetical protein
MPFAAKVLATEQLCQSAAGFCCNARLIAGVQF